MPPRNQAAFPPESSDGFLGRGSVASKGIGPHELVLGHDSWVAKGISAFRRDELRNHPERLFVLFATFWVVVNVSPLGFGTSYLIAFYQAFTYQRTDQIFPVTYATAVVLFLATWFTLSKNGPLVPWRGFLIAGTAVFAGPGAFEVIYQEAGKAIHPSVFAGYAIPYVMFSYGSWVLLGLTGAPWWRFSRRVQVLAILIVIGWATWFALGFPLVIYGTILQYPVPYALNIALKIGMFLFFVLPIWEGRWVHPGWTVARGRAAVVFHPPTDHPADRPTQPVS